MSYTTKNINLKMIEVLTVDSLGDKGENKIPLTINRLTKRNPSTPPSLERLVSSDSTKNIEKKICSRPKRKAISKNYGEWDDYEMTSKEKVQDTPTGS